MINQNIYNIDLPTPSKKIVKDLISMGAFCQQFENTKIYMVTYGRKKLLFYHEFNPLVPYMYGVIFSRKKYWSKVLNDSKIRVYKKFPKSYKKLSIFVTRDHLLNALKEDEIYLEGDGATDIYGLVKKENLKRINSDNPLVLPIKYSQNLKKVLAKNEIKLVPNNFDYQDVTEHLDSQVVSLSQKIIDLFPGIDFIRFDLYIKDYEAHSLHYSVGDCFIDPGLNIFLQLKGAGSSISTSDYIIKGIINI